MSLQLVQRCEADGDRAEVCAVTTNEVGKLYQRNRVSNYHQTSVNTAPPQHQCATFFKNPIATTAPSARFELALRKVEVKNCQNMSAGEVHDLPREEVML